jgi:hypothetical protein
VPIGQALVLFSTGTRRDGGDDEAKSLADALGARAPALLASV